MAPTFVTLVSLLGGSTRNSCPARYTTVSVPVAGGGGDELARCGLRGGCSKLVTPAGGGHVDGPGRRRCGGPPRSRGPFFFFSVVGGARQGLEGFTECDLLVSERVEIAREIEVFPHDEAEGLGWTTVPREGTPGRLSIGDVDRRGVSVSRGHVVLCAGRRRRRRGFEGGAFVGWCRSPRRRSPGHRRRREMVPQEDRVTSFDADSSIARRRREFGPRSRRGRNARQEAKARTMSSARGLPVP